MLAIEEDKKNPLHTDTDDARHSVHQTAPVNIHEKVIFV